MAVVKAGLTDTEMTEILKNPTAREIAEFYFKADSGKRKALLEFAQTLVKNKRQD